MVKRCQKSAKSVCLVCNTNDAKYKCTTCMLPFCSVSCSKTHKLTPCQKSETKTQHVEAVHKQRSNQNEEEMDEDAIILTSEQLHSIDSHEEVQRKVRDEKLMLIIKRIDSAPDRAIALEKEMKTNPDFLEFCDDILEAVGCKNAQNNEVDFEEMMGLRTSGT